jgi:glutamyl-tRNA reductase
MFGMRLALIHRPTGAIQTFPRPTAWRTCLREVQFVDPATDALPPNEPVLHDADAYALLLEIVCGLRSPLIGETEVQAQFKAFMATLDPAADGWLRRLGERVLADAKSIRQQHMQGFGSHSYGWLAARWVHGDRVALVGTGALAQQVLNHLAAGLAVDVWGRRLDRRLTPTGDVRTVRHCLIAEAGAPDKDAGSQDAGSPVSRSTTTVVVAAPVGEHDLNAVVGHYRQVTRAIDLRAVDQQTAIDPAIPLVSLSTLLAEGATASVATASVPAEAAAEVRRRARAFASREELRPFGWDDLCA